MATSAPASLVRRRVGGAARRVVLADDVGHVGAHALRERVGAAHLALELRELADHQGDEVALREVRAAGRGHDRRLGELEQQADLAGQALDALGLAEHGAEALLEDDAAELLPSLGERVASRSVAVEEARVGEAGAHHPVVAAADVVRAPRAVFTTAR